MLSPVTIAGPRLTLREFTTDDLAAAIDRAHQSPRPDYYLAVTESDGGALVGFVRLGLTGVNAADLGYAIRHDRWGRGYATEASRQIMRWGFTECGLHRIQAACGPDNLASQRVIAHLGMTHEGRIRDHVFTNGAWRDSLTYSVLEHEWTQQTAGA